MELNVDRGMWAIVALLIAVVIGAAVMLIFPNFVGQIGNEMSELMTSPSKIINKGNTDLYSDFVSENGNAVINNNTYSFDELGSSVNLIEKSMDTSKFVVSNTNVSYEKGVHPIYGEQIMPVYETSKPDDSLMRMRGVILDPDIDYTFSIWARTVDEGAVGMISIDITDIRSTNDSVTNEWKQYKVTGSKKPLMGTKKEWYDFVDFAIRTKDLKVQFSNVVVRKNNTDTTWNPNPIDYKGHSSDYKYLKSDGDTIYSKTYDHVGQSTKTLKVRNNSSKPMYVNDQLISAYEYKELKWTDEVNKISITSPTGLDAVISGLSMKTE